MIDVQTQLNHRDIQEIGDYAELTLDGLTPETANKLYYQMLRLRRIEEALHAEYHPANEMRCPIHFCIGQEAIPAALSQCLLPDDFLFSHHRSHGYYFAKGSPLRELFAELYGRETGANGGKAGSQDISHTDTNFFSGAILAGSIVIGTGVAFGLKLRGSTQVSVCGFGEGATDEGTFWEAVNFAASQKLPILFLIENNRYSTASDQLKRNAVDNICDRVKPFGVRSQKIFGNDCPLAYRTIMGELDRLRNGDGPSLLEAYTFRWNSHVGPEDDSVNQYRTEVEMAFWKSNCPVQLLEQSLLAKGWMDLALKHDAERAIAEEISGLFNYAKNSAFPAEIDWRRANMKYVLESTTYAGSEALSGLYDQYQADAKLAPY